MDAKDLLVKEYVTIEANDRMTTLIGKLKMHGSHSAVIMDGKKYIGMIDKRLWVRLRMDSSEAKVKNFAVKVPAISKGSTLKEVARLMYTANAYTLPVLEKDKVIGVVCAHDVIGAEQSRLKDYTLEEVSSMKLITVNAKDTVGKVVNTLKNNHIDRLPVLDGGKLVGIVTTMDLLERYFCFPPVRQGSTGRRGATRKIVHMGEVTIDNEMSRIVQTTKADARLDTVASLMDANHISSLVVVDSKGKPIGIVTVKDLLGTIART